MPHNADLVKRLYQGTLLVMLTPSSSPNWLVADDERGAFIWRIHSEVTRGVGGNPLLRLGFAARISIVRRIELMGEGSWDGGQVVYMAARFFFCKPLAGFDDFTVGAVLIRGPGAFGVPSSDPGGAGPLELWAEVAECMAQSVVRMVFVLADPPTNVRQPTWRLQHALRVCLASSGVAEHSDVTAIGEAYGRSVQMLAVGRCAGFDGELVTEAASDLGRMGQGTWRYNAGQEPASVRGTLDHFLPPGRVKYLLPDESGLEGGFFSVWLRGDARRSAAGEEQRVARAKARGRRYGKGKGAGRGKGRGRL